jgi:ABC-2 type transport system permease protein
MLKSNSQNPFQYRLTLIKEGFKIGFKKQKAYKSRLVSWIIADLLQFTIMTVILLAVVKYNPLYTQEEVILYYLLVVLFSRFCYDFTHEYITKDILSGDFSKHILRPGGYLYFQLGDSLGTRIFRFLTIIPVVIVMAIYLGVNEIVIIHSVEQAIQIVLATILAFSISFILSNLLTMTAFFVKQIYGMKTLYNNIVMVFNGEYLPLNFMPASFAAVLMYLPFRFMLFFPIQITLGWIDKSDIWWNFALGLGWLVLLLLIFRSVYKNAVNKFEGEGI